MIDNKFNPNAFFGESRIKLVDGLVDIFDQVNKSGESCWVSLEAPSGWGKTKVAHELYARLAARQSTSYWPPSIIEATDANSLDVADRRKRVYPEPNLFERASHSLPDFMWWGIACEMRNNQSTQFLLEDLEQIGV